MGVAGHRFDLLEYPLVNVGDTAPDFELLNQDDEPVKLSRFRGQPVARVKRFHDKQSLNFTLLADEDHAVTERYGARVEKSMHGKKYWGAQRTTFVIDESGTIAHVIPKASPKTHDAEVLPALEQLAAV